MGLYYRIFGITSNHSFWADEAFISSVSRDIVTEKTSLIKGASILRYQYLQIVITAFSFSLFGISEFSARLPMVLFGVLGIFFAFLVAKKLSNSSGGLLAAFLMAFSQINLAHATQAKPYVALQTLLFVQIYLLIKYVNVRRPLTLIMLFFITCLAYFFHPLAILFWIPLGITLIIIYFNNLKILIRKPLFIFGIFSFITLTMSLFGIFNELNNLLKPSNGRVLFVYNNTMYLKNIFLRQYGVYLLPALLSFLLISKKYCSLFVGLISYVIVLLFMWNFRSYSHNMRYLMTFFGLIFVFFGVFWGKLSEKISERLSADSRVASLPRMTVRTLLAMCSKTLPLIILAVVYISGYKIVQTPQVYYSPNLDLYGDVQNADYKTMYSWIEKKYGKDLDKIVILNDLIDSERFYLKHSSNAYFMKGINKPTIHPINKTKMYGTLGDFLNQKTQYKKGILIIEDWESFLPEDIKQYAKQNMRFEYRVEKMSVGGERDIWPLEVRSWGF